MDKQTQCLAGPNEASGCEIIGFPTHFIVLVCVLVPESADLYRRISPFTTFSFDTMMRNPVLWTFCHGG